MKASICIEKVLTSVATFSQHLQNNSSSSSICTLDPTLSETAICLNEAIVSKCKINMSFLFEKPHY